MPNKHRYTAAQVEQALIETKGMMFIAAQRLGCDPETIRNYCRRYPSVQAAKDAQRGAMIDLAELKLWQAIQEGEAWGITLCLKTLGKDRGYVEQQKLALTNSSGEEDATLTLKVVYEDAIDVTPTPPLLAAPQGESANGSHA